MQRFGRPLGAMLAMLAVHAMPVAAQRATPVTVGTRARVPVRELAAVEATSTEPFKSIMNVRQLEGGTVLVNDGIRRQLILLDNQLGFKRIVIDSVSTAGQSYGPIATPFISYLADSTLFVDGRATSLVVIDPRGNATRVMSVPSGRDLRTLAYTTSGTDDKGNLLYLVYPSATSASRALPSAPGASATQPARPDSAAVVRANFDTRAIDTVGRVRIQASVFTRSVQLENGQMQVTKTINPVTSVDEWAVLSDGSVAFIRGHDYHIDWLMPNGEQRSSAKLPFDWKPLGESDKLALIDSARKAEEKSIAEAKTARKGAMAEVAFGVVPMPDPTILFVPLTEMGDYYPAMRYGAAKADQDGALWILPTTSAHSRSGELIYDVVNNRGELVERVRIPHDRSIAGFGKGGVVYLMFRDGAFVWHLERTRVM
jgi:hypothetical protein